MITAQSSWEDLLSLHEKERQSFNETHLTAAMNKLTKLCKRADQKLQLKQDNRFKRLQENVGKAVPVFREQAVANSIHALASLAVDNNPLLFALCNRAKHAHISRQLSPQGCANIIWSLTTLSHRDELLKLLIERFETNSDETT